MQMAKERRGHVLTLSPVAWCPITGRGDRADRLALHPGRRVRRGPLPRKEDPAHTSALGSSTRTRRRKTSLAEATQSELFVPIFPRAYAAPIVQMPCAAHLTVPTSWCSLELLDEVQDLLQRG